MDIHVVRPGETLYAVAAQYGLAPTILAGINGIGAGTQLVVGQTLIIREPAMIHTVLPGDTVFGLARRYGTTPRELFRNNVALGAQESLYEGEPLVIAYADEVRLGSIEANGYAYPYIEPPLLDTALPYLSYLTPFTYGISASGALLPLGDEALLDAAGRYRTATLMHLSTLTEEGSFSNERSSILLNNPYLQERLIQDVIRTMEEKGFYGLDVDFEFVLPGEREAYAAFIATLRERLNPVGYPVIVALAPKTRADQPGLLYEAHDYALLGAAADAVLLMTYGSDC